MVYLGSALMVFNIISYVRYAKRVQAMDDWGREKKILYIPIVLLVLFLLGYLLVGIIGEPDLIVSGILFGGSIFVFIIFQLIQRITNRIQEHERVEARMIATEQRNQAKTSFLSSISHEMRTPMNAIIGLNTVALKNPDLPAETRSQLEKLGVSARHLMSLIDGILDMSEMESGGLVLRREPFSLRETLETVHAIIQGQCEAKGLTYAYSVGDGIGDCFAGDPVKLRQLLLSLLENAVKFTPAPGTVTFAVEQAGTREGDPALRFTVADTGVGISRVFLPRVFEAFSQEDDTTTNRFGGSGLGLAVAKSIADAMGGELTVESEKGRGSTFAFTVSLPAAEPEAGAGAEAGEPPGEEAVAPLAGCRMLVVEDIDINAEIIMDLLDMEEIEAERAENGQIAVDHFAENPPDYYDAILMDLRMPVMDGLNAARAIRSIDRPDAGRIPIVALTANAMDEDRKNVIDAGMNAHLSKPVDAELLFRTLGSLIAQSRAARGEESGS